MKFNLKALISWLVYIIIIIVSAILIFVGFQVTFLNTSTGGAISMITMPVFIPLLVILFAVWAIISIYGIIKLVRRREKKIIPYVLTVVLPTYGYFV